MEEKLIRLAQAPPNCNEEGILSTFTDLSGCKNQGLKICFSGWQDGSIEKKGLAAKSDNLSLIPRLCTWYKETEFPEKQR